MPASLGMLPVELLEKICFSLHDEDTSEGWEALKMVREVGHRPLQDIATHILFDTVAFWFSIASLEKMCNVANSPTLCVQTDTKGKCWLISG